MTLSLAITDGRIDDLAVRALLELDDNGIGDARIRSVLQTALEMRVRFSERLRRFELDQLTFALLCRPS